MAENYSVIFGWLGKDFSTPIGSDDKPEYGYVKEKVNDFDESGKKVGVHEEIVFKQTGTSSISEYINSFNDTTDIKKIFARYQMGDVSVLTKRVGEYLDTVGCPETLLDAQLMMKNGESIFNSLPSEIREKYGNDALKFVQACQDGSISDVITGLAEQQKVDQEIKNVGYKIQDEQAQQIKELKAQIAELKGVKYE